MILNNYYLNGKELKDNFLSSKTEKITLINNNKEDSSIFRNLTKYSNGTS